MQVKLYTYFRSSAAYRVRIGLNIKGLSYESIPVNLRRSEHRSGAYAKTNAQRLVPALRAAEGDAIPQSLAILEYLDEQYSEPPLLPAQVQDRAQVRAMSLAIACDIHPLNNLRVLEYLKNDLHQSEESVGVWYRHWVAEGFDGLEQSAARFTESGKYMYGDELTLADVCMVPQWHNAQRFKSDLSRYPTLASICTHLQSLPAFVAARPENQPDAQ